jgi:hypothetical protein
MNVRSLLLILVLAAPSLRAQTILPSHFGRWTAANSSQAPAQSPDARDGAKDVFAEAGLQSLQARTYSNGAATAIVTSYQFHDSSGAYEAYTYLREPGTAENAGTAAANSTANADNRHLTRIGNIVIVVDNAASLAPADLDSLSRQVGSRADKTPPPPIPDYLPERDRIPGTEKYALGPAAFRAALSSLDRQEYAAISDAAGFSSGAEAMLARYRTSREDTVLLLIEFPTPQLAGLHWKHLDQALPPTAKTNGTSIERKGSLLAIVLSPSSPSFASRIRDAVNYETQVTWNEPTHTLTDPPITSVLAKIIIATGVFMLVAIVFGVAFGGVRVLLKAFFPGKIFDRPEQMDVLQLGLSGKRINSRDFY